MRGAGTGGGGRCEDGRVKACQLAREPVSEAPPTAHFLRALVVRSSHRI